MRIFSIELLLPSVSLFSQTNHEIFVDMMSKEVSIVDADFLVGGISYQGKASSYQEIFIADNEGARFQI